MLWSLVHLVLLSLSVVPLAPHQSTAATYAQRSLCPPAFGWTELSIPELLREGGRLGGTNSVAAGWTDPSWLYAGGNNGVYRSSDCGSTWEPLPLPSPRASAIMGQVATDPSGRLYVRIGFDVLAISEDGGQSWTRGSRETLSFSVSAAKDRLVYATLSNQYIRGPTGLARSEDGGLTWEIRARLLSGRVQADPLEADVVYRAFSRCGSPGDSPPCGALSRSLDGGATSNLLMIFPEVVTRMSMSPDGSRFWVATGGTLYRSVDRGETWDSLLGTPVDGPIIALSASPHDPGVVFVLTRQGKLWAYREAAGSHQDATTPYPPTRSEADD